MDMNKYKVRDIIRIDISRDSWSISLIYKIDEIKKEYHYIFLDHHRLNAKRTKYRYSIEHIDNSSNEVKLIYHSKLARVLYNHE